MCSLPRWDLSPVYPSFDSAPYREDRRRLKEASERFLALLEAPLTDGAGLLALIRAFEEAANLEENLHAYAEAVYTTNTRDRRALEEINALEAESLPLGRAAVMFRRLCAATNAAGGRVEEWAAAAEELTPYRFFIRESVERGRRLMSDDLEDLANDLGRSGAAAWTRLQEAVSSTIAVVWDRETGERKTGNALRDLAMHPDRAVRERAYHAELEGWRSMEIPLAAALNGVKGTAITLDRRRGWESALQKSAFQSRLGEASLTTLIAALEGSLPLFRRYLKAKARLLGVPACAFFDLFAPLPGEGEEKKAKKWSWEEATDFIARQFEKFDPDMGAFARRAVAGRWIDAEGREGKIGGAYCTDFPLAKESRILCNFEGSFDSVSTVAHELGHAWHHEVLLDLPRFAACYPMTLAETASIFAETLVFESAFAEETAAAQRLSLLEGNLKDCCQVVVDILSRFYFEQKLFQRRERGEAAPEELCAMMLDAQERTYGDALDRRYLHPYMWAVKSHYYNSDLGFYNYPYAFGQLFALGLYARCRDAGPGRGQAYRALLRMTGSAPAEEVIRAAGFSLEGGRLWEEALAIIARRVEEFETLALR